MRRAAFTLIELLVVVVVIAVILSLVLPALSGASREARASKCAAHLRQLIVMSEEYATAHRGAAANDVLDLDAPRDSAICPGSLVFWKGREPNPTEADTYTSYVIPPRPGNHTAVTWRNMLDTNNPHVATVLNEKDDFNHGGRQQQRGMHIYWIRGFKHLGYGDGHVKRKMGPLVKWA